MSGQLKEKKPFQLLSKDSGYRGRILTGYAKRFAELFQEILDDKSFVDVEGNSKESYHTFVCALFGNIFYGGRFAMIKKSLGKFFENNGKVQCKSKRLLKRCMYVLKTQFDKANLHERAAIVAPYTEPIEALEIGFNRDDFLKFDIEIGHSAFSRSLKYSIEQAKKEEEKKESEQQKQHFLKKVAELITKGVDPLKVRVAPNKQSVIVRKSKSNEEAVYHPVYYVDCCFRCCHKQIRKALVKENIEVPSYFSYPNFVCLLKPIWLKYPKGRTDLCPTCELGRTKLKGFDPNTSTDTDLLNLYQVYHSHRERKEKQKNAFESDSARCRNKANNQAVIVVDFKEKVKLGQGPNQTCQEFYHFSLRSLLCVYIILPGGKCVVFDYVSDDISQRWWWVESALKDTFERCSELKDVKNIIFWSDGGKSFKNKEMLSFLINQKVSCHRNITWKFFTEYHGKSSCDRHFSSIGTILKAYMNSTDKITSSAQLVEVLTNGFSNRHCLQYVEDKTTVIEVINFTVPEAPAQKTVVHFENFSKFFYFSIVNGENGLQVECKCYEGAFTHKFTPKLQLMERVDKPKIAPALPDEELSKKVQALFSKEQKIKALANPNSIKNNDVNNKNKNNNATTTTTTTARNEKDASYTLSPNLKAQILFHLKFHRIVSPTFNEEIGKGLLKSLCQEMNIEYAEWMDKKTLANLLKLETFPSNAEPGQIFEYSDEEIELVDKGYVPNATPSSQTTRRVSQYNNSKRRKRNDSDTALPSSKKQMITKAINNETANKTKSNKRTREETIEETSNTATSNKRRREETIEGTAREETMEETMEETSNTATSREVTMEETMEETAKDTPVIEHIRKIPQPSPKALALILDALVGNSNSTPDQIIKHYELLSEDAAADDFLRSRANNRILV